MGEIRKKMGRFSLYIIQTFHYPLYIEHVIRMQYTFDRVSDLNCIDLDKATTLRLALKRGIS
jgi:hypothetical protein